MARKAPREARLHDARDVRRIAATAMGRPGFERTGLLSASWAIAGGCQAPVPVELNGAPAKILGGRKVRSGSGRPFSLLMHVRCRRCAWCLGKRRNLWAFRGQEEIRWAPRTWFATFTLSPANGFMLRARAAQRLRCGGTDFERLSGADQFLELQREYGAELTKFFKRLRKNTGAKLRYILVAERHKSGAPHYHALIHEVSGSNPLRHASLQSEYKLGHSQFKLCNDLKSAWYVAKYLAKSLDARVRASLGYGHAPSISGQITTSCPREACWPPVKTSSHQLQGLVAVQQGENDCEVPSTSVLQKGSGRRDQICPAGNQAFPPSSEPPVQTPCSEPEPPQSPQQASASAFKSFFEAVYASFPGTRPALPAASAPWVSLPGKPPSNGVGRLE